MDTSLLLDFSLIPKALHQPVSWQRFIENCSSEQQVFFHRYLSDKENANALALVWTGSAFIAEACVDSPALLQELLDSGDLCRSYSDTEYDNKLSVVEVDDIDRQLRQLRRREIIRVIWRDLLRYADTIETMQDMSHLADACINHAYSYHYPLLCEKYGVPTGKYSGQQQALIILAMGKLGAKELNVSSDIDLIFSYPEPGQTEGGGESISNHEFFIYLAQKLIKSIDRNTVDGFVFRVDMRLRPYGESGALVLSFDAMEEYYQHQGREWERYALIKARSIRDDSGSNTELLKILQPFIYRRYIDFSVVDALRGMKRLIVREVKRKGTDENIKLGYGGIREIEFVTQCAQLIHGGRDADLRTSSLLAALDIIGERGFMPRESVNQLKAAYFFLRNVEHVLQGYKDQQTQLLPEDDAERLRVAFFMGFTNWDGFYAQLDKHRQVVSKCFASAISSAEDEPSQRQTDQVWYELWESLETEDQLDERFIQLGYDNPEQVLSSLKATLQSISNKVGQTEGRQRIDKLMPLLLAEVAKQADPCECLQRLLQFIESVLRRTCYLVLLIENPQALTKLVSLFAASPWIAEEITNFPILLDQLLDSGIYELPPERDELKSELSQQLARVAEDDQEQLMDTLRYFKMAHILNVAASEISGKLPLMKVSDYLTYIAEVVLDQVVKIAWRQIVAKYGSPARCNNAIDDTQFAIIGYGKLGGIEMGYGSDLDLVFIADIKSNLVTDGDMSVPNSIFYLRLGQRIIHILHTRTSLGQLYETDMRLRPDGNAGELVCTISAFKHYQARSAWTWEHQALVRARPVVGSEMVAQQFITARQEILCEPRDADMVRRQVNEMRDKMVAHLGTKPEKSIKSELFHLKQDPGGIVDIEFMVQYAVLVWAHKHPAIVRYTDNIRILETLQAEGLFSDGDSNALIEAYKQYRAMGHRLALQQRPHMIAAADFDEIRDVVRGLWRKLLT